MIITINTATHNGLLILSRWDGDTCDLQLHNPTDHAVSLGKIDIVSQKNPFPADTWCYGEGYSMLAQYRGTANDFQMFGSFGDISHYCLPAVDGYCQAYNMMLFSHSDFGCWLIGLASCHRFTGIFRFNEQELNIVLDGENAVIQPGETIDLERLFCWKSERNELLKRFSEAIQRNHPRLEAEIPTGWCSWTVYGPEVTEKNVLDNLKAMKERELPLKFIQIDDGYQPYMGDWLNTTEQFEDGLGGICNKIRQEGFAPAIWVAPFIAEQKSTLFREHPDWFVKDEHGFPLPSDRDSFGGWRCAPWYMLDGTHPEARKYLTHVFKTMREKWGITYFKLDANMWGALPFGHRYNDNATCVEAYRWGMKAILEGAGDDSFVLGCNAPLWPSLGLVHGMRLTNDNMRNYEQFYELAKELFPRNWQNKYLWINDPDTILLQNKGLDVVDAGGNSMQTERPVTEDEFLFNAAYTLASGGMVLSGDDITNQPSQCTDYLKKLLPPSGIAAVFDDENYTVGRIEISQEKELVLVFNYHDTYADFKIPMQKPAEVSDFWSEQPIGFFTDSIPVKNIPPHSAKILVCKIKK